MTKSKLFVPVLGAALLIPIIGAQAASVCKGLPQATCEAHEVFAGLKACKWMTERQRADGGVTKAYCRGSGKSVPTDATKSVNSGATKSASSTEAPKN